LDGQSALLWYEERLAEQAALAEGGKGNKGGKGKGTNDFLKTIFPSFVYFIHHISSSSKRGVMILNSVSPWGGPQGFDGLWGGPRLSDAEFFFGKGADPRFFFGNNQC
jgi:hypothetical protein